MKVRVIDHTKRQTATWNSLAHPDHRDRFHLQNLYELNLPIDFAKFNRHHSMTGDVNEFEAITWNMAAICAPNR